ncbi:hypothetical protein ACFPAF_21035 [Hymenobacter endophyticus]|uniref:Uncharacterized protein n=1 Tax=Hymenobacter endophyticus TaxID=3076335 RepID=A0ABU3TNE4_9BACT|nr:hypothetical protein [Hymenobacter endophyticus]MDU0372896.1 hypothetical protein [Hymenobacter endophyticus]
MSRQQLIPAGTTSEFRTQDAPGRSWPCPAEAYAFFLGQLEQLRPAEQVGAWCIAPDGAVTPQPAEAGGITVEHLVKWLDCHELYMQPVTTGPLNGWWLVVQEGAGTREWNYPALPLNAVGSALILPAHKVGKVGQPLLHGTVVVVEPQQWKLGSKKGLIAV